MNTLAPALAALALAACGLNIATLRQEHLQPPAPAQTAPIDAPVRVDVQTAERYAGFDYSGQVSVETEVIRDHVIDALRANGVSNIVDDAASAEYLISATFRMLRTGGTSTLVGFTSTWELYGQSSTTALATTAVIAEETVNRFGLGKARFRDAAARSIEKNTQDGLAVLLDSLRVQR